jgi:hypothetical protein
MRDARETGNKRRAAATHLDVEHLEARQVLTSFASPWPEPSQISLSFALDGVVVGSHRSDLYATLDRTAPAGVWKEEILRAFQTWAVNTNVDIGVVNDGGQPLGSLGLKQGDARFGDVRIAAFPMADDVVAAADPYDPFVANTWVGDLFLNSSTTFGPAGSGADHDLFSVILHEAGHVLGLGHSEDPASPMFAVTPHSPRHSLTPADVHALQTLYGIRSADSFDATATNDRRSSATPLTWTNEYAQGPQAVAAGDLSTPQDVDHYRFALPTAFGTTEIRLQAAGLSLLTARVSLIDSAGNVVAVKQTTDPLKNDLLLSVAGLMPHESYVVRIESARPNVFGIGRYELSVSNHTSAPSASTVDWVLLDTHATNDEFGRISTTAATLTTTPGYVEHTYYEEYGYLSAQQPSQVYRVRSADLDPSLKNVYTVVVTTDAGARGHDRLRLLDEFGRVQHADILYRADGAIEVQIPSVASNRDYFIEISSADGNLAESEFEVTVDFDQDGGHLQTYVNESMTRDQEDAYRQFVVVESGQFHFVLSTSDLNAAPETGVAMTVRDADGRIVMRWSARDGEARAADFFFNRGVYTVEFTRADETSRQPMMFRLAGLAVSDPIGPQLRDTILEPVDSTAGTTPAGLTQYWLPFSPGLSVVAKQDGKAAVPLVVGTAGNNVRTVETPPPIGSLQQLPASILSTRSNSLLRDGPWTAPGLRSSAAARLVRRPIRTQIESKLESTDAVPRNEDAETDNLNPKKTDGSPQAAPDAESKNTPAETRDAPAENASTEAAADGSAGQASS